MPVPVQDSNASASANVDPDAEQTNNKSNQIFFFLLPA
jgi:hypothetical protein